MNFSRAEVRAAILRAADTLKNNPSLWQWSNVSVPDCGSPACAIGHIGLQLGLPHDENGFLACSNVIANGEYDFYRRMSKEIGRSLASEEITVADISNGLRAYADRYFPAERAEQLDPSFVKWRSTFSYDPQKLLEHVS